MRCNGQTREQSKWRWTKLLERKPTANKKWTCKREDRWIYGWMDTPTVRNIFLKIMIYHFNAESTFVLAAEFKPAWELQLHCVKFFLFAQCLDFITYCLFREY